jgi:hypothetical protein
LGDGHFTKSLAIVIELHKNDFEELFKGVVLKLLNKSSTLS